MAKNRALESPFLQYRHTFTKPMMKRLRAFELWCYRRMLKISWTAKTTNEEVLRRMSIKDRLTSTIQKKKTQYFGHIMRHDTLQRVLLDGKVEGKRGRGRPRASWSMNITEWTGLTYITASRTALERDRWRTIASNPETDGT